MSLVIRIHYCRHNSNKILTKMLFALTWWLILVFEFWVLWTEKGPPVGPLCLPVFSSCAGASTYATPVWQCVSCHEHLKTPVLVQVLPMYVCSLPCSQETVTGALPKLHASIPFPHHVPWRSILILSFHGQGFPSYCSFHVSRSWLVTDSFIFSVRATYPAYLLSLISLK